MNRKELISPKNLKRINIGAITLCFCTSSYVAYYKLIIHDDWGGFLYDICLGLFTGIMAGIALYYLTVLDRMRKRSRENRQE